MSVPPLRSPPTPRSHIDRRSAIGARPATLPRRRRRRRMSDSRPATARPATRADAILRDLKDRSTLDIPIVDAHHHLWDLSAGRYPSKQDQYDKTFFLGDCRKICRDYLPADYAADLRGIDIVGTVHIQAGRAQGEQVQETEWLTEVNARSG